MAERLQQLQDRLLYPSSQDGKDVLRRLVPPSAILIFAANFKRLFPAESGIIAELGLEQRDPEELARKIKLLAIPGMAAAGLAFLALSIREKQNRVPYGGHLTVSKVATNPGYYAVKLFPELSGERFVGEVHFKGKWKMRYSPEENALTVMRKLYSDLHKLAEAVERDDPALSDFQYFVALSSMVTPFLEKFGFKVVHFKDQLGLPALGQKEQANLKLLMRPVMGAAINKEVLVVHKNDFARFGR